MIILAISVMVGHDPLLQLMMLQIAQAHLKGELVGGRHHCPLTPCLQASGRLNYYWSRNDYTINSHDIFLCKNCACNF